MSAAPPSFLSEASGIARESINPVNIEPALFVGGIVFVIVMYITFLIANAVKSSEDNYKYNSQGCQIDSNGNVISQPVISKGKTVGQNNCVTRTHPLVIYGFGIFFSSVLAFAAGSGIYKISFYLANPRLGAGLFVNDMLFRRR